MRMAEGGHAVAIQPQRAAPAERAGNTGDPHAPLGLRVAAKKICAEQFLGKCFADHRNAWH